MISIQEMMPIPERELLAYQAELKGEMFRALCKHFREGEVPYTVIANRLGIARWRVERMLTGQQDLRIDQMVQLARALDCRFKVTLITFDEIRKANAQFAAGDADK